MNDDTHKPVLADHVSVKKKLVPPFLSALGDRYSPYSWAREIVPELIWIALAIERYGYREGLALCLELVEAAAKVTKKDPPPLFAKFSAFSALTDGERTALLLALDPSTTMEISAALEPISSILPSHPLSFLADQEKPNQSSDTLLPSTLHEFYDRHSRLATLSMSAVYYLGIRQGRVKVMSHLVDKMIEDFDCIEDYPNTERSRQAASSFRAGAPMMVKGPNADGDGSEEDDGWVCIFWDGVAGFGPCQFNETLEDEVVDADDEFESFIVGCRNAVRSDLRARLDRWPLNLNEIETYEVVAALLCRQATLTIDLASAPGIWNPHTAPIILRAMADVFISLAWILKEPESRSKRFVEDGLGAIKLQIAHRERELASLKDQAEIEQMKWMIDLWKEWLDSQRMSQFIEVNLGSWSGLNTRQMAIESGFLDFYNYVYQPFSSPVHSNWAHVSMFNTVPCENPAHRMHRSPAIAPTGTDAHWLFLAVKYLSKTFGHFDQTMGFEGLPDAAFEFFEAGTVRTSPTGPENKVP